MKKTIISAFLVFTLATSAHASVYIIKKGDTLTTVSQKFGIPLEKLKNINPTVNSSNLKIGQKIQIPSEKNTKLTKCSSANGLAQAKVYVVQKGDNTYNIAKKIGCSIDELKTLNPNINLSNLNIGDRIIIPNSAKTTSNTQINNVYIVKSGDTASLIASKYNIALFELEKLNPQLNLANINIGDRIVVPQSAVSVKIASQSQEKPLMDSNSYTVEPKDTLKIISKKTGISMSQIRKLNPNVNWSNLQIGEKIALKLHSQQEQVSIAHNNIPSYEPDKNENYIKYTVASGDTLYSIAKAFSTTTTDLKKINSLSSNNLSMGQTLLVPPKILAIKSTKTDSALEHTPTYQAKNSDDNKTNENSSTITNYSENSNYSLYLDHYTVQKGDTLYKIAKKFNMNVDDIISLNNLPDKEISVGQILLIPNNNTNIANTQNNYSTSEYSLVNKENSLNERLIKYAKLFVGTPYQWGGTNLATGVDCSGFVQDVFAKFHIDLPRTSSEQFNAGRPVSLSEIKPGDLLFFQTYAGTYPSHVGIYIGDNKFISALNQSNGVVISPLDGYFLNRFVGARRVLPPNEKFDNTRNRPG